MIKNIARDGNGQHAGVVYEDSTEPEYPDTLCWWPPKYPVALVSDRFIYDMTDIDYTGSLVSLSGKNRR